MRRAASLLLLLSLLAAGAAGVGFASYTIDFTEDGLMELAVEPVTVDHPDEVNFSVEVCQDRCYAARVTSLSLVPETDQAFLRIEPQVTGYQVVRVRLAQRDGVVQDAEYIRVPDRLVPGNGSTYYRLDRNGTGTAVGTAITGAMVSTSTTLQDFLGRWGPRYLYGVVAVAAAIALLVAGLMHRDRFYLEDLRRSVRRIMQRPYGNNLFKLKSDILPSTPDIALDAGDDDPYADPYADLREMKRDILRVRVEDDD